MKIRTFVDLASLRARSASFEMGTESAEGSRIYARRFSHFASHFPADKSCSKRQTPDPDDQGWFMVDIVSDLAQRYALSEGAVQCILDSLRESGGKKASFNHPD